MNWNITAGRPVYVQLIEQLELALVAGEFPPGSRIPPVRELAADAGVNPNTMQRALQDLESRGLLQAQRTAGRTVTANDTVLQALRRKRAATLARDFLQQMHALGMTAAEVETLLRETETSEKAALDGVDFTVEPGKLVGLLGPNGSGKTTLIKISAGLLTADSGTVCIDKAPVGVYTKAITSYLPDRMALPTEFTAADAVSLYTDFFADFDRTKANAMLADLHLNQHDRIGAMSKGTQEKMQLCLTMSRAAKLYLLDEPLGGVDPAAREYILNTILHNYSEDAALVLSTHLIGDIEKVLDEVIFLKDGSVMRQVGVDELREETGTSVDAYFREAYKC